MKNILSHIIQPSLYDAKSQDTLLKRFLFVLGIYGPIFPLRASLGLWPFVGIVVLLTLYHIWYTERRNEESNRLETVLTYFVVYFIGFNSLWGFIGHTFFAESVAASIGWATGSHFQTELAFYHLAFAGLGAAVIWYRGTYIGALVVSKAVFLYGAAYTHIVDIIQNANYAPSNAGFEILYFGDIIVPTLLIVLFAIYHRTKAQKTLQQTGGILEATAGEPAPLNAG